MDLAKFHHKPADLFLVIACRCGRLYRFKFRRFEIPITSGRQCPISGAALESMSHDVKVSGCEWESAYLRR